MKLLTNVIDGWGYSKVRKRLDKVDRSQVSAWASTSLWTVQEGLEHANDRAGLEQSRTNLIALLAAVDSLLDRTP